MSKLSELQYDFDNLRYDHDVIYADVQTLIETAHREHNEHHADAFQFCTNEVCRAIADLDNDYH